MGSAGRNSGGQQDEDGRGVLGGGGGQETNGVNHECVTDAQNKR
jgi:hypothetical protein